MGIKERILKLEKKIRERERDKAFPDDSDNFIEALGVVDPEGYRVGGGFDFLRAINDTAKDDWKND